MGGGEENMEPGSLLPAPGLEPPPPVAGSRRPLRSSSRGRSVASLTLAEGRHMMEGDWERPAPPAVPSPRPSPSFRKPSASPSAPRSSESESAARSLPIAAVSSADFCSSSSIFDLGKAAWPWVPSLPPPTRPRPPGPLGVEAPASSPHRLPCRLPAVSRLAWKARRKPRCGLATPPPAAKLPWFPALPLEVAKPPGGARCAGVLAGGFGKLLRGVPLRPPPRALVGCGMCRANLREPRVE